MNKFFTGIMLMIFLGMLNTTSAANVNSAVNASLEYKGAAYSPGIIIIKIKPQFRTSCSVRSINLAKLNRAFSEISVSEVSKKFPQTKMPAEPINKRGQKLIDLSLIYQINFSPVVKLEEALKIIQATGVVEYAEPLYLQKMDFIPSDPSVASQYALAKISAYTAWDVWTGDTNIVIGIVDSGTDWDHPDLQSSIKYNYADPIDGLDNDSDGFIDNYRGWDVSENDNDPMVVGSTHGSHVSGCANATTNNATGVAGPAYNCKFLPVKSALDASSSTIDNGYDGIVYAADHGADIINCSWGRAGIRSQFEQETVDFATINNDALIVAAAGNDPMDQEHFPSSYRNVISVAATTNTDGKANFSTYNATVDVCAPGANILSTIWNNSYTSLDGTSMSSPIAAGCAAMIKSRWPSFSALQVGEQLRTTCDNIYGVSGNTAYQGKLGKGRVNLYKAITDSISPGVILKDRTAYDGNDNVFIPGDTLSIIGLFENLLRPTTNLSCSLSTNNSNVQILQANFNAGVMSTLDTLSNFANPYRVIIKPTAPLNSEVVFKINLSDGTWSDNYLFSITVNVDYINIAINNIATSITSKSLIGYNATQQLEGLGFTFMNSPTILYDMGLMVGAQGSQVSDNVRNDAGNDLDFAPYINVTSQEPGTFSDFDVHGVFKDNGSTSVSPLNLVVTHNAYAWVNAPDDNYVMVQYFIKNNGTSTLNNLYAGLFADWDIPAYANNKCSTDNSRRMGYIWSTDVAGLYGGIKLLSHTSGFNHYAFDNTAANGGIDLTDGFSNAEKYTSLSTSRADAGLASPTGNDVLSAVSTGPFNLAAGDSVEVAFALMAGNSLTSSLQATADAAQIKYDITFVGIEHVGNAESNQLYQSYPNPADKNLRIDFMLKENSTAELTIYNILGEKVKTIVDEKLNSGKYSMTVDVSTLPSGNYYYRLDAGSYTKTLPLNIVH